MNSTAEHFDAPPESDTHATLRDDAWMGGPNVEGPYLLGMILGKNFFRLPLDDYVEELHSFITTRVSPLAAEVFCTEATFPHFTPFLKRLYERETNYPTGNMPRNERVERGIEYLLHNLAATTAEIAAHLNTTEKQVQRLSEITYAQKEIRIYRES